MIELYIYRSFVDVCGEFSVMHAWANCEIGCKHVRTWRLLCGSSIVFAVKNGAVIGAKGSEQRTTYHKGGKGRIQHADEVKPAS